ncbi:hypothetical protein HOLleu_26652 [Holothuria leucospilota]|uniref:Uncharacterized protein n=1 Tax=Holothuria leucospilota TaxID=206669 RepID=A0A9Q1H300_HOLLE|nr:hypothetical protein HOLleu_26652 [Holothuria leucospilota]
MFRDVYVEFHSSHKSADSIYSAKLAALGSNFIVIIMKHDVCTVSLGIYISISLNLLFFLCFDVSIFILTFKNLCY